MAFSDRQKSTAIKDCRFSNCNPRRDLFYQFSMPLGLAQPRPEQSVARNP
jgi:hypothetical protein